MSANEVMFPPHTTTTSGPSPLSCAAPSPYANARAAPHDGSTSNLVVRAVGRKNVRGVGGGIMSTMGHLSCQRPTRGREEEGQRDALGAE